MDAAGGGAVPVKLTSDLGPRRVKRLLPPMNRQFFAIGCGYGSAKHSTAPAIRAIELLFPVRIKSSHTASVNVERTVTATGLPVYLQQRKCLQTA